MKFKELAIGDTFNFIDDNNPHLTSFWSDCKKTGKRSYQSIDTGRRYKIGSINASVFHVNSTLGK